MKEDKECQRGREGGNNFDAPYQLPTMKLNGQASREMDVTPALIAFLPTHMIIFSLFM